MRLQASIDNQRPVTTPVFLLDKRIHAVDISSRIGPRERDPQKVSQ